MTGLLQIILYLALACVTVILGAGIFALFRGGEFGRSWSNKLMRARVLVQFIAVLLVVVLVWIQRAGSGG